MGSRDDAARPPGARGGAGGGLPPFPALELEVMADVTAGSRPDEGFVRVRRRRLQIRRPDGTHSAPFAYDEAWRVALDAVVVAAHCREGGRRRVFLRSSFRPPAALRPPEVWPVPEGPTLGHFWELPAGLVEADERSAEGLLRGAARELAEETGFAVEPGALAPLGPPNFSSPGLCGERLFFYHVEVDPASRREPEGDGSPLEHGAVVVAIDLDEALALARAGRFEDMKTEVGVRRLADLF
jgi:ADP-ribose pyrophosphatase